MVDFCMVPMGVGVSVSKYVVACQRIFEAAGLSHEMHSYGTNVEGDWDKVNQLDARRHPRRSRANNARQAAKRLLENGNLNNSASE
jgi:uncharacterized protein (TIGR00106 family)